MTKEQKIKFLINERCELCDLPQSFENKHCKVHNTRCALCELPLSFENKHCKVHMSNPLKIKG
jgi:hypothetical protein